MSSPDSAKLQLTEAVIKAYGERLAVDAGAAQRLVASVQTIWEYLLQDVNLRKQTDKVKTPK